jgi:hypothetical protein
VDGWIGLPFSLRQIRPTSGTEPLDLGRQHGHRFGRNEHVAGGAAQPQDGANLSVVGPRRPSVVGEARPAAGLPSAKNSRPQPWPGKSQPSPPVPAGILSWHGGLATIGESGGGWSLAARAGHRLGTPGLAAAVIADLAADHVTCRYLAGLE